VTDEIQTETASSRTLIHEFGIFLVATAMVLRDTIARFEQTTASITEQVMMRSSQADRDLIVMFQDFDRLNQEFVSLAEVLIQAAAKPQESWLRADGGSHPAEDAVAAVSIAHLKERLIRQLDVSTIDLAVAPPEEEAVF
jgi:hypothetical protein